ncbi:hypothetical protein CIPAW_06G114000 [Carya illinoinensis]|uniref:Uncharacterized protein n=1 Tax=Carya illinoinensis TaxID=32201 RepID=A0A8T1QAT6_CARIL|nr:hypothetical protein CIPAW_06G114000 [Carya illinoinensis]
MMDDKLNFQQYACYNGSVVWKREEDILRRREDKLREKKTNAHKVEIEQNL